jgi:hypothetical protein
VPFSSEADCYPLPVCQQAGLTNNPKLEAGIELKKLTKTLCETNEDDFVSAIHSWYNTWSLFLKERTTDSGNRKMALYPQEASFSPTEAYERTFPIYLPIRSILISIFPIPQIPLMVVLHI